jgi:hypothetical protein
LLFAAPVWADNDSDVKGLWIEIPGLPEAGSTSFNVQSGGEGEAYFERIIDDGALVVSVERVYAEDRNGDAWKPGDAAKLTVRLESIRKEIEVAEDEVDVTESEEELAEIYSYPVATTIYVTGEDEDMRGNQDIFIFTDDWVFRVHLSLAANRVDDYDADEMKGWLENMKIVARNSSGEGEREYEDEADKNPGGEDDAVEGLWLEIPKFPKDAEVIDFAQNEDGVAALSRMIDDGLLVLVVERLKNAMDDGEDFTADKVGKFVAEIEELGEDDVDVTENEEEFAELYSYPVASATYITGENEDTRNNLDLYMFTDKWVFRVKVSISADHMENYGGEDGGKLKEWFYNMKLRD